MINYYKRSDNALVKIDGSAMTVVNVLSTEENKVITFFSNADYVNRMIEYASTFTPASESEFNTLLIETKEFLANL